MSDECKIIKLEDVGKYMPNIWTAQNLSKLHEAEQDALIERMKYFCSWRYIITHPWDLGDWLLMRSFIRHAEELQ